MEIPEGWHKNKICDVAIIDVGRDLLDERFSKEKCKQYCFPVYSNTVEQFGHYGFYDTPEYTAESVTVVARGIGLGTAFARTQPFGAIGRLLVLSPIGHAFDVNFLADYLNNNFRLFYESGGIPQLPGKTLGSYTVILPPLPEQKQIAEILGTWDKAIATMEALIAASEAQKKALMQQLLTGKRRLPGFEGAWKEVKLGDVAEIAKGRALSKRHLTPGDYPVIAGGKSSPYSHGDFTHEEVITVSASGAYAGYVAYHSEKIWASDCSTVIGTPEATTKYVFELLRFNQRQLYRLQSGGAQPHIYPADIASLKIVLPQVNEQLAILKVLSSARGSVSDLQAKLQTLKTEKAALMQQLLTGKRRVKLTEAA